MITQVDVKKRPSYKGDYLNYHFLMHAFIHSVIHLTFTEPHSAKPWIRHV